MAPSKDEDMTEEAPGRDEFNSSLSSFAEERGITIDFQARVNTKYIDLYKLWNLVTSRGGYDALSAEKLAWRGICNEFHLGTANAAAYAFSMKTLYYKNLVAYEIKTIHHQEPPPVSILEKVTAKGGDVLGRTIENFQPPQSKPELANGATDSEDEEAKTPKEEKMDIDDPSSGGGRVTRGLRQAPAPRQLFQPDVSAPRQTRHSSSQQSPQPAAASHTGYNYAASSNPNSASFAIQNYEPKAPTTLMLRPLLTPSQNLALFKDKLRLAREARRAELGLASPSTKGMMKPGAGFEGPNIYVRTLQGLRSQVPEEQDYALHHLVKISHERGDKYKFEAFPNLAEGLIEYVLGISSLFYDVKWDIDFSEDRHEFNTLDGINGTPDILQKIQCLKRIEAADELEPGEFAHKLTKTHEAALTIRNLSLLEDNATYLSELPQIRDFLSIALNLPSCPAVAEMKFYALEIAEQITRFWQMEGDDPLYQSLLAQIGEAKDRGAMLIALRCVSRISMSREEPNYLRGVPVSVVRQMCEWLLLDDDELIGACLDFFYQYTAIPENLAFLLSHTDEIPLSSFLAQLARLLQHNASTQYTKIVAVRPIAVTAASNIPNIPEDLLQQFLEFDEPDRSNHWLRAAFEEDPDSHITQIDLWQAYQKRFTDHATPQTPLLQAADFIKNVSTIFAGANAQVVQGTTPRFIIKGIRYRHAPMDPKGRVYNRCLWKAPGEEQCSGFFLKPKSMFDHIVSSHIGVGRTGGGAWDLKPNGGAIRLPHDCFWADCLHFSRCNSRGPTAFELGMHIKTHLPDQTKKATLRQKHNRTPATQTLLPGQAINGKINPSGGPQIDPKQGREASYHYYKYESTADLQGNADGLPLPSALVLRMIAKNMPKAAALLRPDDRDAFCKESTESLFAPLRDRFVRIMAYNKAMAPYISDVLGHVDKWTAL
ncbi:Chromatin structure-remodeling complex protein rsc9 [Lecanora helva]